MFSPDSSLYKGLLSLGFTKKETCVYLALLELGKGTVSEIARKAEINRTTGYDILDQLVSRGLVSISGKEPKQEYAAESPEKIKKFLRQQAQQIEQNLKQAEGLVPQLKSVHNVGGRPQVRFYEGREGLEQVYEDTLTSHETIRAYANVEDMHRAMPGYFPKYYHRRARKGIFIRAIFPDNEVGLQRHRLDASEMRESVMVPLAKYFFSPEINIYDNKVMIASWREKLGIIIESKEIAEAMKSVFELAWAEAKRQDIKNIKS